MEVTGVVKSEAKNEEKIIEERKEKFIKYIKKNPNWVFYILLAIIAWLAYRLRTLNLPGLRDVATNSWTLGPDLDPFLFLRWAEYIVANGSLMAVDVLRYSPLGYETKQELILLPYMIAWFHKLTSFFSITDSVVHSAVLFPAFMFVLTIIAFFFLSRKIFIDKLGNKQASIIALAASFFLAVLPSLIPRTIAGIPEKESAAFFFMFATFYLFLSAWKSHKNVHKYIFALLSGISTAAMALVWGGFAYIFIILGLTFLIAFLFGQVNLQKLFIYGIWLFSSFVLMQPFSSRYTYYNLLSSTITGFAIGVLLISAFHFVLWSPRIKPHIEKFSLKNVSPQINSLILALILGAILVTLLFGINFIPSNIKGIKNTLVTPVSTRLGVTVAENKQPFFEEWANNFGPSVQGVPLFFWLFFIGSVFLFYYLVKEFNKKERIALTSSYLIFLLCIVFSRYKPDSILNGTNSFSLFVYLLGFITLIGTFGYYYYHSYRKEEEKFRTLDIGIIMLFALFFFSIVSARGAVRVIMVLVPAASLIASYFVVSSLSNAFSSNDEMKKMFSWILAVLVVLSAIYSGYFFYRGAEATSASYAPSEYTHQWQYAMSWVRENTPENAVFGHWWDYGYWLQTIGKRATVLDGGNQFEYWDHLMGRHALTSPSEEDALDFLYSHNTTHFLIDSSDIGKYGAFSSIGSDKNYDRASWIPTFMKDREQVMETKKGMQFIYTGGSSLDSDIVYENNGSKTILPGGKAGVVAISSEVDSNGSLIGQPIGIFAYQNKRYDLPLRYAFSNGNFTDFGSGVEAGIFIMPQLIQDSQGISIDVSGALLYLGNRTVKSQLARLYLYNEETPHFKLVHSEDDFIVKQIKANSINTTDIIFFGGVRGPIRIWEINYPSGLEVKEEYLSLVYPEEELRRAG